MSLNLTQLKTNLGAAFDATLDPAADAATAKTNFVNAVANAIDAYVKTATIQYTSGLTSATGGPVTGTFVGGLQ